LSAYLNLLPSNIPANVISDMPSGNGITAAKVCEGGPPIKIETFKFSPFLTACL